MYVILVFRQVWLVDVVTTEEMILARYGGPLLTYEQVAELLHRSPGGLRITMCRSGSLSERLRECRVRIGRRVLFRVTGLVEIVDGVEVV